MTERRDRRRFGEIASAVAVVLSLVFVGLEVRESARQTALNTQSLQVSTYQDLIVQISNVNALLLENSETRQLIIETAESSWDELSADEQGELRAFFYLLLRHGDLAFYQYELGMLTEERMESALAPLYGQLCKPAFRAFWEAASDNFAEGYRHFIDERFSDLQSC